MSWQVEQSALGVWPGPWQIPHLVSVPLGVTVLAFAW